MEKDLKPGFLTHSVFISGKRKTAYFEFVYVTQGSITFEIADEKIDLGIGEGIFMVPDIDVFSRLNADFAACRNIYIDGDFFRLCCDFIDASLFTEIKEKKYARFKMSYNSTLVSEEKFVAFLREPNVYKRKRLEKILAQMLISELLASPYKSPNSSKDFYNQCTIILNTVYTFPDYMQRLQEEVGYHKVYLCKKFKETFGVTVGDYVKELRLQFAEYHLKTTDYPATKICSIAGIESFSYFNKIFKKKYGVTPTKYRIQNRKSPIE